MENELISNSISQIKGLMNAKHVKKENNLQIIDKAKTGETLEQKSRELHLLNDKLQQTNKSLEDFSYIISHDLKTPLRMIFSYLDLLKKRIYSDLDGEEREYLDIALNNATQMRTMIDSVLQYSRAGTMQVEKETVNLRKLVDDVIQLNTPDSKKVELQVETKIEVIKTSVILLKQVLGNLLSNSLKYNDKDICKINISITDNGSNYIFQIKDNGPGIDEKFWDRIFLLFHTLQGPNPESTGLGLAIVKRIIETQGGKIWLVKPEDKIGIQFSFTWPK